MEIFQSIWTALTTPNEFLTNILSIPLAFLDAFISMLFFTSILNIKTTRKQKLEYVLILGLLTNLINFIVPYPFIVFLIDTILWPVLVIYILKTSIFKGILSEGITLLLSLCLESFITKFLYIVFKIDSVDIIRIPLLRCSLALLIYIIILCITYIIKHFKLNIKIFEGLSKKSKKLLAINAALLILIIASQFYLILFYNASLPIYITLISIIGLLSYFTLSIYSIINISKLEITSRDLEQAQLYNKTLAILHDGLRAFKHDFHNIVHAIGGYVDTEDLEGLRKYYSQLLTDCQRVNNLTGLSPETINHPAIYNVLANKYHKANETGIKINLEIFLDLSEIDKSMKIYEFTRILGILLDNSIEAAKECDEKLINLTIRKDERKHQLLLIIENTYKNKNVDTEKIYEKGFSTKTGNTGLGLWEVRQILKRNDNLNLFTSKDSEYFKQQLEIYY
ncbi:MAG: GHKL domain-containing protein [Clostridia bacterium]